MLNEKRNITASFAEHLKSQGKLTFTYLLCINSGQSKLKKTISGHGTFEKCYIQCAPQKKQYHCFFREAPKISRKIDLGLVLANLIKKSRIRTLCILKLLHTECYTQEAITLFPSRSTSNFKKKWFSHMYFGLILAN